MNLLITKTCNRSCPYCFAQTEVTLDSTHSAGNISFDAFKQYLSFLKNNSINSLKLLGGEPTMHPYFIELIDLGLKNEFTVTVFSNGIWKNQHRLKLRDAQYKNIQYLINVNENKDTKAHEKAQLVKTLEAVGEQVQLSFNIFRQDFDLTFLQDVINTYGLLRSIRVGLSSPIVGAGNSAINVSDLKHIGKRLIQQMTIMEAADILVEFDCGFTYCMFEESDAATIVQSTKYGLFSTCDFIGDVDYNLDVWPCFPLSNAPHVNLEKYNKIEDIRNYYKNKFSSIRSFGSTDECLQCKYLRRNQCCGGCLARSIEEIVENGDSSVLSKLSIEV